MGGASESRVTECQRSNHDITNELIVCRWSHCEVHGNKKINSIHYPQSLETLAARMPKLNININSLQNTETMKYYEKGSER